jgi:opacity protein-like surface antigen
MKNLSPFIYKLTAKLHNLFSLLFYFAFLIILSVFTFSHQEIFAQAQFNLRLQTGFPLEEFAQQNESVAFGIGGLFLIPLEDKSVISLGLDASYMIYGMQSEDYTDNNGFNYTLNTNNNIFESFAMVRFKPRWEKSFIYPYVDGLLGGRYIYTRTTEEEDGEDINSFIEQDGFSFAYGGAGGLLFSLSEEIKLDIRAVYTQGSRAKYLTKNSIYPDPLLPDKFIYDVKNTRTDMLSFQVGITFFLD